jgi:hypothetical protein
MKALIISILLNQAQATYSVGECRLPGEEGGLKLF